MSINRQVEDAIPSLRHYARKLMRDRIAAEDLLQECLVRGLSKQHLWREGSDLRAWLFTILHNLHANHVRRTSRHAAADELREAEALTVQPPTQEKGLEFRDVCRAMTELTAGQRDAVLLIGLEGWSYDRVAEHSGVPVGTVRSRLSRGRRRLKLAA